MTEQNVAGNINPLVPVDLETLGLNLPGTALPTTGEVIEEMKKQDVTVKPGHFSQLRVDGSTELDGPVHFGASQRTDWFDCSPTGDAEVVLDLGNGSQQYLFLTRDTTVWLPTEEQREGMFSLLVEQDTTGGWVITWMINNLNGQGGAVVLWPDGAEPVMSPGAGATDMYSFTWCQLAGVGEGAYIGMSTQNMSIPVTPA
jgi:hypothetical protein